MTLKKVSLLFLITFCQLTFAQSFFVKYQAEDAELEMKMDVMSDGTAEGGAFITTPDIGSNWGFSKATFNVQVPRSGKYALYTRTKATTSSSDSFYIAVNGNPRATWGHGGPGTWTWKKVRLNGSANPVQYDLPAGDNEIVFSVREDGSSLDAIALVLEETNAAPYVTLQASDLDFNTNPASLTWAQTSPEVPLMIRLDEADATVLQHPMTLGQDLTAENTGFAYVAEDQGDGQGGFIQYDFEINNPDQYTVYARVKAPDAGSDTLTFRMNSLTDRTWKIPVTGNQWQWLPITSTEGSNTPDDFSLVHGINSLRLIQIEDGVQVDSLIVTPASSTLDLNALNASSLQQITNRQVQGPIYEFQAEDAELFGLMTISDQPGADYGKAVLRPENTGNNGYSRLTFHIDLPIGDEFALFARVKGPIGSSDSFRFDINGGTIQDYHIAWASTDFAWRRVNLWPSSIEPPTWNLPAGKHTITFWNREDGAMLDSIALVSTSSNVKEEDLEARHDIVFLEAESASGLTQPMQIHKDQGNTRYGSYIAVEDGLGVNNNPSGGGQATFTFKVRKSGTYRIFGRTLAVHGGNDSFYFQLDDLEPMVWSPPVNQNWLWYRVMKWNSSTGSKTPMQFQLEAGEHTITLNQREDGTSLDALMISNDLGFYFPEHETVAPHFGSDDAMFAGGMFLGKGVNQQFIPFATIPQSRNGKDTVQTDWYGVAVPNQDYVGIALSEVDQAEHQLSAETFPVTSKWHITTEIDEAELHDKLVWSWRDVKTGKYWTGTEWIDQAFFTKVHHGDIPILPGSNGVGLSYIADNQVTAGFFDLAVADNFWASGRMSIQVEFRAEIGSELKRIYNGSHQLTYTTWEEGLDIQNARPLVDVDIYSNDTAYWQAPLQLFNGQDFDPQYLQWQWHRPTANLTFDGTAWIPASSATWRSIQGGTGFWSQFAIVNQNIEGNIDPALWDGYWFNNNSDEPIEIRFAYNPPSGTPGLRLFNSSLNTTFRMERPPIATAVSGFGVSNEAQPIITVQQPARSIIFMGYQRPDGTWLDEDWRQNNPGLNFTRPPVDLEPGVNYRVHVASWNGRFGTQNLVGSVRFEPPTLSVGNANIQEPNLARNAAGSALMEELKPTITFDSDPNATHYFVGFRDQNGKWHESDWRQHQVTTTSYSPRTMLKAEHDYDVYVIAANAYTESVPKKVGAINSQPTPVEVAYENFTANMTLENTAARSGLDSESARTADPGFVITNGNLIEFTVDHPEYNSTGQLQFALKSNTTGLYWTGQGWQEDAIFFPVGTSQQTSYQFFYPIWFMWYDPDDGQSLAQMPSSPEQLQLPWYGHGMWHTIQSDVRDGLPLVKFYFQSPANYHINAFPRFFDDSLEDLSFEFGFVDIPLSPEEFWPIGTTTSFDMSQIIEDDQLETQVSQQLIQVTEAEPNFNLEMTVSHSQLSLDASPYQFKYFIFDTERHWFWNGSSWVYNSYWSTYQGNNFVDDLGDNLIANLPSPFVNQDGSFAQTSWDNFFDGRNSVKLKILASYGSKHNYFEDTQVIIQRQEDPYEVNLTVRDFILPAPSADMEPVRLKPVDGSTVTDIFDPNDFTPSLIGEMGSYGDLGAAVAFRLYQVDTNNQLTELETLAATIPLQAFADQNHDFTAIYNGLNQLSLNPGHIYYLGAFLTFDHQQSSNGSSWQPIDYPSYIKLETTFAGQTKRLLRRANSVQDEGHIRSYSHRFEFRNYQEIEIPTTAFTYLRNDASRAFTSAEGLGELYAANTDESIEIDLNSDPNSPVLQHLRETLQAVALELFELVPNPSDPNVLIEGNRVQSVLVNRQGSSPITQVILPLGIQSKDEQHYRFKVISQDIYGFLSESNYEFGSIRNFDNTSLSFAFATDENDDTYYQTIPDTTQEYDSCKNHSLVMENFNFGRYDNSIQTIKSVRVKVKSRYKQVNEYPSDICEPGEVCSVLDDEGNPEDIGPYTGANALDLLVDRLGQVPPQHSISRTLNFSIQENGTIIGESGYISIGQLSGTANGGNTYYQIAPYPITTFVKEVKDEYTDNIYTTDENEQDPTQETFGKAVITFKPKFGSGGPIANRAIIRAKIEDPFDPVNDYILNYISRIGCSPEIFPPIEQGEIELATTENGSSWSDYTWTYSTINNTYFDMHSPDSIYMRIGFDQNLYDSTGPEWQVRMTIQDSGPPNTDHPSCDEDLGACYLVSEMSLNEFLRGAELDENALYDINPRDIWNTNVNGELDLFLRRNLTPTDIPNGRFSFTIRIYREGTEEVVLSQQNSTYLIGFERDTTNRNIVYNIAWDSAVNSGNRPTQEIDYNSNLTFNVALPFNAFADAMGNHSSTFLPGNVSVRWIDHNSGQYWNGETWSSDDTWYPVDIHVDNETTLSDRTRDFFRGHTIAVLVDSINNTIDRRLNMVVNHQTMDTNFFDGQASRQIRVQMRYQRHNDGEFRTAPDLNFPFMTLLDSTEDTQGCTDCDVDPEDSNIISPKHFQTNAADDQLKRIMAGASDALPASIRDYLDAPEPLLLESALTTVGDLYWVVGNSVSNDAGQTGVSEMEAFHWQHTGNPTDTAQKYNTNHPEVWAWFRASFNPEVDDTKIYAYIFPYRDDVESQSNYLDFENRETVALRQDSANLWRSETNLAYKYVTNDPDSEKNYYLVVIAVPESKLQKPELASFNASLGTTRNSVSSQPNGELGDILLKNMPIDSQNRLLSINYLDESSQQQLINVGFWDRLGYQLTSRAIPTHVPVGSDIQDLVLMGSPGEIDIFGRTIQSSMGYYRDFDNSLTSEQSFSIHFSTMTNSRSQLMQSAIDYWSGNSFINPDSDGDTILEQTNTVLDTNPITQTIFENDSAKGRVLAQTGLGADFQNPETLNYQRIYYFSMAPPTFFEGSSTTPSSNYPIYNLMTRRLSDTNKRAWMEGVLTVSPSGSVQIAVAGENKEEPILTISNPSIALMQRWGFNIKAATEKPGSDAFVQGDEDAQAINNADIYLPQTYHDMHDTNGNPDQNYLDDVNLISYRQMNEFGKTVTMYPPRGLDIDLTNTSGDDWGITVLSNANDLATHYEYDDYHNVKKIIEADAGESRFIYNRHGWLRFSQSQTMALSNSWFETIYDINGRILKSRVIYPTNNWSDATLENYANASIAPASALSTPSVDDEVILDPSFQVANTYDVYPQHQGYPWPNYTNLTKVAWPTVDYLIDNYPFKDSADFTLGNPMGQVTQTVGPETAERFYYDHRGNLIIHLIIHARMPQIHTLFYDYNFFDQVERFSYPQGGQHYGVQYDGWQRVVGIFDLDPASVRFMAHVGHQGSFTNEQQALQFHYPADVPFFAGPLLDTSSTTTTVAPNAARRMVTYNYNASGQVTSMVYGDTQPQNSSYKYDKAIKESYFYDVRSLMLNKKVLIADHQNNVAGNFQNFLEIDLDYFDNNPNLKTSTVLDTGVAKRYTGDIGAILEKHYMFDPSGDVPATHSENQMGFQYDLRGQLINAAYAQGTNSFEYTYRYDKHGNRLKEWRDNVPVDYNEAGASGITNETLAYEHDIDTTNNRLTEINIAGVNPTGKYHQAQYQYHSGAGALTGTVDQIMRYIGGTESDTGTNYDQINFTYDNLTLSTQPTHIKEQKRITDGTSNGDYQSGSKILDFYYNYNAAGARLREIKETRETDNTLVDTEITHWLPMGNENLAEFDETGRLKRSYLILGTNRIGYKSDGRNAFYIKDHLGSTRSVVDLSNTDALPTAGSNYADSSVFLVARSDNGPYGNPQVRYQNEEGEPHQFTGQETHETGLYNYGARYYDALAGRFASVDPAREFNNSYSYVGNNPVMFVDPDGLAVKPMSDESYITITRMVPKPLRSFIKVVNGLIDVDTMKKAVTDNENFNDLLKMAEHETIVEVYTAPSSKKLDKGEIVTVDFFFEPPGVVEIEGQKFELGLSAWFGQTLIPDADSHEGSTNENVQVYVNNQKELVAYDERLMVITMAHELFVHALPYLEGKPHDHNIPSVDESVPVIEGRTWETLKAEQ